MRSIAVAAALAALTLAGPVMAQNPAASATDAQLSRAQVLADLDMWHAAGMTYMPSASAFQELALSSEYQRGMARYEQLRAGPSYQQAVAKHLGAEQQIVRQ